MVAIDPTLETLAQLDDPSRWIRRDGVPVFDEHDEFDADGNLTERFGERELQELADNCNRRERETGDACPITDGHTLDDVPEDQQPQVLGYARHFRVGRFGPQQKLAVLCTFYIRRDKIHRARELPRRSVERWVREKIFDPIALLVRTPERDLGLLTYRRQPGLRIRYAKDYDMANEFENKDLGAGKGGKEKEVPAAMMTEENEQLTPDEEHLAKSYLKKYAANPRHHALMRYMHDLHGDAACKKYGAEGPGLPAGGNTFAPGATVPEKARMQKEQEAIHYGRLEHENQTLKGEVEALKRYNRRTERERDLIQLEAEGYQLDRAEELDAVTDLDAATYVKHIDKIRKRYHRIPIDPRGFVAVARGHVEGGAASNGTTEEQKKKAVSIATAEGISYDAALARVKQG